MAIDSFYEIGNFFKLRDVILNLLRVVLFYSRGRGSFYAAATPRFITDYRGPILGLSNEVSFVLNSRYNLVKINQTSFLLCVPCQYFLAPVYALQPRISCKIYLEFNVSRSG